MTKLYLVLAILGTVLPYGAFVPWLFANGVDIVLFAEQATVNAISTFAWLDVLVSAIVSLVFIVVDGTRNRIKYYQVAIVATLTVGVSCGLPLYLYLKEKQQKTSVRC
ncbi:DUF2834 domain-containing protein [Motilimonas cestriensis]|uniref:DUF2834 domain-containing protein n=1 Tax=Motilimonas cestriensis TaxID=2742685 RepID=A0ABS8W900_9GAMM|nr:DUF2834 domain-containing protein [Motilimonas cestriensis]MCE2594827.1 DUF2834 domain-containing protein [Motilimonas cestriensis]